MEMLDCHIHSISPDAGVPLEAMCEAAVEKGLQELTVTDHYELFDPAYPIPSRVFGDDYLKRYRREYEDCRDRYAGRLRLLFGIELGQPVCDPGRADEILAAYPFDFVIGSAHKIRNRDLGLQDYRPDTARAILLDSLELLWRMADGGDFDSLAHMDLIRRYSLRAGLEINLLEEPEHTRRVLRRLVERGKALEINTSEVRRGGETMPCLGLLRVYRELGGELVTVGSDAHRPRDVGAGIGEALEAARQAGFRFIARYQGRRPELIPIG